MWITNYKRNIDPERLVKFHNGVKCNIISSVLPHVKVNLGVIIC